MKGSRFGVNQAVRLVVLTAVLYAVVWRIEGLKTLVTGNNVE